MSKGGKNNNNKNLNVNIVNKENTSTKYSYKTQNILFEKMPIKNKNQSFKQSRFSAGTLMDSIRKYMNLEH